jgi:hypothetical protein
MVTASLDATICFFAESSELFGAAGASQDNCLKLRHSRQAIVRMKTLRLNLKELNLDVSHMSKRHGGPLG